MSNRGDGYDPVGLQHPSYQQESSEGHELQPQPPSLQSRNNTGASYQTATSSSAGMSYPPTRRVQLVDGQSAASPPAQYPFALGAGTTSSNTSMHSPGDNPYFTEKPGRSDSPMFRKMESDFENYHSRNASESHLQFADGDIPQNKVAKVYHYLLNVSIFTRWVLFIVPMLAIIWIPGILQLTTYPDAQVWSVKLLWWSIWLSVVWGGWWAATAVSRLIPGVLKYTIGVIAVGSRRYIEWASALHRYVALFAWTLGCWVSFNPLIDRRVEEGASEKNEKIISFIARLLFGIFLCACILLAEKFCIQFIATKFHERSYADRIAEQKFTVRALVVLYRNSSDIPGRSDTLRAGHVKSKSINPAKLLKQARRAVRTAATTTTTALGNVASEIAGTSVLQPNSPQAMVKTALESANKTRLLARRLFYSFAKNGSDHIYLADIMHFFTSKEEAERAFSFIDRDVNGDATIEEVEMACLDVHREQLAIEHSMQDLDSAVGRLDNIFMSLYVIVAVLIIAVVLDAEIGTLITSASTLVLGLSWLIGSSLAEVLISIIFLFIKHPFDVGDRVMVDTQKFTVKEIRLLSTIMLDSNGTYVQAPNSVLNTKFILNIRRSPIMTETFTFDVSFATSFEDLEELRRTMLAFLADHKREYLPKFDVKVVDFPAQEKMTLSADICYKSNTQQGALASARRNKWIIAMKAALNDVGIYGPTGKPPGDAPPVTRYTQVPFQNIFEEDQIAEQEKARIEAAGGPPRHVIKRMNTGFQLSDNNILSAGAQDIFEENQELAMPTPRRNLSSNTLSSMPSMPSSSTMLAGPTMPLPTAQSVQLRDRYEPGAPATPRAY